eukprot:scaffold272729_cov15-Tisochrysis_lutea.AAC.1
MPGARSKLGAVINQGSWPSDPNPALTPAASSVTLQCRMPTHSPHGITGIGKTAQLRSIFNTLADE